MPGLIEHADNTVSGWPCYPGMTEGKVTEIYTTTTNLPAAAMTGLEGEPVYKWFADFLAIDVLTQEGARSVQSFRGTICLF